MNHKLTAAISLLMLSLLGLTPAYAITSTTFHGSNCHALNGSQAGNVRLSAYGLTNVSSSSTWVTCPIPSPVEGWSKVLVAVKAPASMSCKVYALKRNGGIALSRSVSIASYGEAREATISSAHSLAWSYTMYCNMPAGAKVLWYRADERTVQ